MAEKIKDDFEGFWFLACILHYILPMNVFRLNILPTLRIYWHYKRRIFKSTKNRIKIVYQY